MKRLFLLLLAPLALPAQELARSPRHVQATRIDPNNYYGVTVANGMTGIVSSPEPLKVKDVVLNGAYDTYGRGRVSNILKVFDFANMDLEVGGRRLGRAEKGADGKYHIINVVAADEYAENVDDNAFTSGIAKEVMGYANADVRGEKIAISHQLPITHR